jgi:hypothetical protein
VTQASQNLFNLKAASPSTGIAHGKAMIRGDVAAAAVVRRGIDLSAGIELEGRLGGELGEIVVASLEGKAQAGAGISLAAAMPLDLFKEAGLIARFRAQAAASASVAATLGLELEVFRKLVRDRFDPPLDALLEIFLDEVRIGAALWGRAAFSAEVYAQAALAGSLLATPQRKAGFTFVADYGAGWGGGAGMEFAANFGLEDTRRMLGRLGDATAEAALDEAESYLRTRPPAERAAAGPALAMLRLLLPLATTSAFQLGFELATAKDAEARKRAEEAVVRSFLARAQETLLEALVELALTKLGELLDEADLPDPRDILDEAELEELQELLLSLRDLVFVDLGSATTADPERWLLAVLEVLEGLEVLLSLRVLPEDVEEDARQAVAMLWAAGTLAHRVAEALRGPAPAKLFGTALAPVPAGSATASRVAVAIGKPAGSGLTRADLVTFLVGADPVEELREKLPWVGDVLDWLQQATGSTGADLLQRLLVQLAEPDEDAMTALLAFMGQSLSAAVDQEVVPKLLNPIKARDPDDEAVRLFIDELVVPLLVSLPVVVLPNLPGVGSEAGRLRMREALSAVLLQLVGQLLIAATDVLLHHGLENSEQALRQIGQRIRTAGEKDPMFATVAAAGARAPIPIIPTPEDVDKILQLCADVVELLDEHEREPLTEAARVALAAGLGTEETREATLAALTESDDPPRSEDLEVLLERAQDGAWRVCEHVGTELLAMLVAYFKAQVERVAKAIQAAAKEIVAAAEAALAWAGRQLAELQQLLSQLVAKAGQILARMAADIQALASHLASLAGAVVAKVRAAAFSALEPLIADFPGWAKNGLRELLGSLFDTIQWLLTVPAQLLSTVAGWVKDMLGADPASAALNEAAVRQAVRQRILATQVPDFEFCLSLEAFGKKVYDIGCISVPAGTVVGAMADTVLADPIFTQTVRRAVADSVELRGVEAQKATVKSQIDGTLDEAQSQAAAADLAPGQPLAVAFETPGPLKLLHRTAPVRLTLRGANRTFVDSVLGVPRRVRVTLNGREYLFAPEHWAELSGGGLRLETNVVLEAPSPSATMPAGVETNVVAAKVVNGTGVLAQLRADDTVIFEPQARHASRAAMSVRQVAEPTPSGAESGEGLSGAPTVSREDLGTAPTLAGEKATAVPLAEVMSADAIPAARLNARRIGGTWALDESVEVKSNGTAQLAFQGGELAIHAGDGSIPFAAPTPEPAAVPAPVGPDGKPRLPGQEGLNVIQVAVADGKGREASGSLAFFLAAESKKPPIEIRHVEAVPAAQDWRGEHIVITSTADEDIELEGWTLRDLAGHVYVLPRHTLPKGGSVRLWTGRGTDDAENLHWGRGSAVWNDRGDAAVLNDPEGNEVHRRIYLPGEPRRPESEQTSASA